MKNGWAATVYRCAKSKNITVSLQPSDTLTSCTLFVSDGVGMLIKILKSDPVDSHHIKHNFDVISLLFLAWGSQTLRRNMFAPVSIVPTIYKDSKLFIFCCVSVYVFSAPCDFI